MMTLVIYLPLGGRLGHANPAGLKPPLLALDSTRVSCAPSSCPIWMSLSQLFSLLAFDASLSCCCWLAFLLPVVLRADLPCVATAFAGLLDLAAGSSLSGSSSASPRCDWLSVGSACIRLSSLDDTACTTHSSCLAPVAELGKFAVHSRLDGRNNTIAQVGVRRISLSLHRALSPVQRSCLSCRNTVLMYTFASRLLAKRAFSRGNYTVTPCILADMT